MAFSCYFMYLTPSGEAHIAPAHPTCRFSAHYRPIDLLAYPLHYENTMPPTLLTFSFFLLQQMISKFLLYIA